jgi:hypothetical protein
MKLRLTTLCLARAAVLHCADWTGIGETRVGAGAISMSCRCIVALALGHS